MRRYDRARNRAIKAGTIKVLIVDEHPVVRAGLRAMLAAPGLRVVGEAGTADAALRLLEARRPHMVLVEAASREANGLELLRQIKETSPTVSLVVITADQSVFQLYRAIALGCSGYFVKSVEPEKLLNGIRAIARGECVVEPNLLREMLQEVARQRGKPEMGADEKLTVPEREIVRLITEGHTNRQIARRLGYSVGTVKDYVQKIIQKLEVSDRTQVAVKAVRLGLLD